MYISTRECAKLLKVSIRRVQALLSKKRIEGAYKDGHCWKIPVYDGRPVVSEGKRGPKSRWFKMARKPRKKETRFVYVSRLKIAQNQKEDQFEPPISVKKGSSSCHHAHEININGPCTIRYSEKPERSKGGAKLWIETYNLIELYALDRQTLRRMSLGFV